MGGFNPFMGGGFGGFGGAGMPQADTRPPRERFATQL